MLRDQLAGKRTRFPQAVADASGAFLELSTTRGGTGYGPLPITFAEIEAWSRLRGALEPWEIDLICKLDRVWMADASRRIEAARDGASGKPGAPPAPENLPEFTLEALMAMAGGRPK